MKNKFIITFIAVCIMLFSLCITSTTAATYGDLIYSVTNGEITITDCNSSATTVVIPSKINGYPVTAVGESAFRFCYGLTSVIIPNSVTEIDNSAFYNCTSLTSITIPDSVIFIGESAFAYCYELKSVSVDNNNQYYTSVDGVLFNKAKTKIICYPAGKTNTSYTLPDNVTSIGDDVFAHCDKLTSITISNNVTSIGDYAFAYCRGLTSINLPDSVATIGNLAFRSCSRLTSITVDNNNQYYTSVDGILFDKAKTKIICYPAGKTNTSYTLPDSVTSIGNSAFNDCDSLTTVTIPNSVTFIGYSAFDNCDNLTSVSYIGIEADWNKISISSYNDNLTAAERNYYLSVTYIDVNGEVIQKDILGLNETAVIPDIENKYYTDNTYTTEFDFSNPITNNTIVYTVTKNIICISSEETAEIGESGITNTVAVSVKHNAAVLLAEIKYPTYLSLAEIIPKEFKYAEQYEIRTENGYTYLTVIAQYSDNGYISKGKYTTPFELKFDILPTASVGNTKIELTKNTYLIGNDIYYFDEMTNAEIEILPVAVKSIEIIGSDSIAVPTQYSVIVLPEYAANKDIIWSVNNEEIATISHNGILTPIKNGKVILTATAKDGSGVFKSKEISVTANARLTNLVSDIGIWDKSFSPYITEYIIFVDENASAIKLTSDYENGTLRINNSLAVKNIAKSMELSESLTEITLTLSGLIDYNNGSYKLTVVKENSALFAKCVKTDEGYRINVILNKFKIEKIQNAILVAALYNNGRFISIAQTPAADTTSLDITIKTDNKATDARLFLLSDLDTLMPLCDEAEITINI